MMRNMWRWLTALCVVALMTACGGGGGSGSGEKAKTTMMVYLVASNLEESGVEDLENMLKARASNDVNVVLEIGGGETAGTFAGIDMTRLSRYHLQPKSGGNGWSIERLPESQQPAQTAMNQPDTLRDFIRWAAEQYPAQQYALTLWDHGGGPVHGFGQDDALGGGKIMPLNDIVSAIKQAGVHFELIGFDACLMASVEVASMLAPHANYLVASEEVTTGWQWTDVVNHMVDHPSSTGADLGKAIVESYKTFDRTGKLSFTAYSVTDLQRVNALVAVLEKASASLQQSLQNGGLNAWWTIALARREAEDFQSNIFSTTSDLVDAKSLVHELGDVNMLSSALVSEFDAALAAAVVHLDGGEDDASGLMMYFPRYSMLNTEMQEKFSGLAFAGSNYRAFVNAYMNFARSSDLPSVKVSDTVMAEGVATADVSVSVGQTKAAADASKRGFDLGYSVLIKDGVALAMREAEVQGNQVRLEDSQRWPTLNGQLVTLLPEDSDAGKTFMIPIAYQPEGASRILTGSLYAIQEDDGGLHVRFATLSQNAAGTGMLEVEPGLELYPLRFNYLTNTLVKTEKPLVVPEGDWIVQSTTIAEPGYVMHLGVTDLTGTLQWSVNGVNLQ
ncbi:clostripain-related cysteine peptidase [Diaphorobacter caeni]|uniref:clostripain-related cysteine peptidase n=1 Tax=Diaphorobacter caeni TaxID=2784387 RepID=UPI00188DD8CF|nr:clostripain-related cysteine peptidase [Diaphorobacter caeni]MBF5007538.1 hypothetical protein [Diaphorobacter caeni]